MSTVQVGGIFGLIEGAPKAGTGSPGYGLEFHVRDADGAYLAFLYGARDKKYRAELRGTGAGSFTINANDPQATTTNLANENIVEVRWAGTTIGYWIIQSKKQTMVADGDAAEDIEVSGPGVLVLLRKAILYPLAWPALTDPDSLETAIVCAPSAGAGVIGLWSANVDLPLTLGFSPIVDSNDTDWSIDVYLEFRPGQSLFDVIEALRGLGYDFVVSPGLELDAYASLGNTDTAAFRQGYNIVSCVVGSDTTDLASVVLGEGQGAIVESTDFTWTTRRRQAGLSARNATTETQVEALNARYLVRVHEPIQSIELAVVQNALTTLPTFGVDYQLGDTVMVNVPGKLSSSYRVLSAELREVGDPRTVVVDLGLDDVTVRLVERMRTAIDAGVPVAAGGAYNLVSRDTRLLRNLVTFDWLISGTVTTGDGKGNIYEVRERIRILDFTGNVQTAPGSTATVNLQYSLDQGDSWDDMFEDTQPTFPASEKRMVAGVFSVTMLHPGTLIRFCVDDAGTAAMANLSARLRAREA